MILLYYLILMLCGIVTSESDALWIHAPEQDVDHNRKMLCNESAWCLRIQRRCWICKHSSSDKLRVLMLKNTQTHSSHLTQKGALHVSSGSCLNTSYTGHWTLWTWDISWFRHDLQAQKASFITGWVKGGDSMSQLWFTSPWTIGTKLKNETLA